MGAQLDRILKDASSLSASDRAQLAHCLISSLDQVNDADVNQAWLDVVEQRIDALEIGEAETLSWEEVKKGLKRPAC